MVRGIEEKTIGDRRTDHIGGHENDGQTKLHAETNLQIKIYHAMGRVEFVR